jgi:hypothetical protein
MTLVCSNGDHRVDGKPFEIADGARRITIPHLTIEWGDKDIRDAWTGGYTFCSFGCLEEQATEWAVNHDGRDLVDGPKPVGDES